VAKKLDCPGWALTSLFNVWRRGREITSWVECLNGGWIRQARDSLLNISLFCLTVCLYLASLYNLNLVQYFYTRVDNWWLVYDLTDLLSEIWLVCKGLVNINTSLFRQSLYGEECSRCSFQCSSSVEVMKHFSRAHSDNLVPVSKWVLNFIQFDIAFDIFASST